MTAERISNNGVWREYLIHLFIVLILGSYGFTWMATQSSASTQDYARHEKRIEKLETIAMHIPAIEAKLDLLLKRSN